jgi:hypothetical protein
VISWEKDDKDGNEKFIANFSKRSARKFSMPVGRILDDNIKRIEVFYAFEFKSVDTTQQKTAAAFSDPQFIFDAIQTMNLPAADRSFESLSLITRKIGVGANKDPNELVDYLRKKLKEREQTKVSAST